jgi:hypothetical protein
MHGNLELDSVRSGQPRQGQDGDRRRERRVPGGDPGVLQVLRPFSPDMWPAQIVDSSKGGLKLEVSQSLRLGTIVQVHLKTTIMTGEVRHCTVAGKGFHVGIKLGEVVER